MIRRILLPVDCSEHSMEAARYAEELARTHGAVIYALGVIDIPGIERSAATVGAGASQYGKEMRERRLDEARSSLGDFLDKLKQRLKQDGIKVKRIRDAGLVEDVIARHSQTTDFVVVSKRVNFEFETSEKPGDSMFEMLEISSRPTMVVPDEFRPIRKLVVAHDLTRTCARVLYTLVQLDPFPGAEFIIVHSDREGASQVAALDDVVGYLQEHGRKAQAVIRNIKPSSAVLEVAEQEKADAIVLGAYDVGTVRRLLLGSTAQRILDHSTIPLIFGT